MLPQHVNEPSPIAHVPDANAAIASNLPYAAPCSCGAHCLDVGRLFCCSESGSLDG